MSLTSLLWTKVRQQIQTAERLITRLPSDRLSWTPPLTLEARPIFRPDDLLGHLLECLAGFCAALQAARPDELSDFDALRDRRRNHRCDPKEALDEIRLYTRAIETGFSVLEDEDLTRIVPTLFSSEGEAVLSLLLNNLEHLAHHKFQLFFYLRLMGIDVGTGDLYILDGSS